MLFLGLTVDAWITVFIILSVFGILAFTRIPPAAAFLGGMAALFISGVLDAKEAFGGFSSNTALVVAIMFVVIAGLFNTGVLRWLINNALGTPRTHSAAITKLMLPVAALSAFMSNTVVVSMFVRVVRIWGKKLGITPSKLLIPLSYASCMGGVCTLIGTPPNLIIAEAFSKDAGVHMGIFVTLVPGLFCLAVGLLSMLAMKRLLPEREPAGDESISHSDKLLQVFVPRDSRIVGMSVKEAGLDGNPACRLIEIVRFDNYTIDKVDDEEFIFGGDTLLFAGKKEEMEKVAASYGLRDNDKVADYDWRTIASSVIMIAMIILSALNVLTLLEAGILAAAAMLIFRCCNLKQAGQSIDVSIVAIFAASICFGTAISKTGIAEAIVGGLVNICGDNPLTLLITICAAGTIITEFISNSACAAILYPIAYNAAISTGANPMTFAIALMIAVSSSFATPIGSPTHMLVYTPGGYKFSDFLKIGLPMNLIILTANIFIVTRLFPL